MPMYIFNIFEKKTLWKRILGLIAIAYVRVCM